MSEMIQLENLPVETLAEMANEAAAACEASGRKTVEHAIRCGRALLAAKAQVKHGEWLDWLEANFDQSRPVASRYMEIANCSRANNLEEATSVRDALRLIAESPEKQAKKQEREAKKQEQQPQKAEAPPKSLGPAAPAPPVSDGIIRNENPPSRPQRPAWLADPDELDRPEEDDLPPLPQTNTHHTTQNRRTPDARETDRAGIVCPDDPRGLTDGGWYVWSDKANRLLPLTDEDILRRADEIRGQMVVEHAKDTTPVVEPVKESVSSKPGKVPTAQQLTTAVGDRVHDGDWQDLWRGKLERSVEAWARYKQSLTGKAKVRSMESWEAALTRIENVAHDRGVDVVCDMIEKAIANGWQGWEHETSDRKQRGAAGGRIYAQLERAEVKYDPLPE